MSEPVNTIEITYKRIETDTPGAIKVMCECPDGKTRVAWVPRSQIFEHDDEHKTMEVAEWVAIEKGFV